MALKILLADDSMTAQNMGKKILVDAGYEVLAVSNGAAAIKKIASDRPDIIILDVYMPGYTGLEVCDRIKGSPDTARIPVLLTVGKMEPFRPEEANRVRADGVMIKPFEATDLIAAVQSIGNRSASVKPMPPAQAHDTTLRIPPPVASLVDTLRIPPPKAAVKHEDTVETPAPKFDHEATLRLTPEQVRAFQDASYRDWMTNTIHEGETPATEAPVIPPQVEEPAPEPELAVTLPPMIEIAQTSEPAVPEMLVPEMPVPTTYEMPEPEPEVAQPFFAVDPVVEVAEVPEVELAPEHTPIAEATHELETSAPVPLANLEVATLEELETTVAEPVINLPVESAPELEINSPIHLQEKVEVIPDAALVTNEDDMSEFVTKFGTEQPEEIAVGLVSDLSPEHLAAITVPADAETVDVPIVAESYVEPELVESPDNTSTNVLDEVGQVEFQATVIESAPAVAFVPGLEDTQNIVPFVPAMVEPTPVIEAVVDPEPEVEPVIPPPIAAVEPEPVQVVEAIAETPGVIETAEAGVQHVEMASAAAAGVAAGSGIGHITTEQEVPVVVAPAEAAEVPATSDAELPLPEPPAEVPVGDAELAEQLAAALAQTEAEQTVSAQAEAAITAAVEPAVAEAMEPLASAEESHTWSDSRLSDAVAKAIEKLKPQLISEILRELIKK